METTKTDNTEQSHAHDGTKHIGEGDDDDDEVFDTNWTDQVESFDELGLSLCVSEQDRGTAPISRHGRADRGGKIICAASPKSSLQRPGSSGTAAAFQSCTARAR